MFFHENVFCLTAPLHLPSIRKLIQLESDDVFTYVSMLSPKNTNLLLLVKEMSKAFSNFKKKFQIFTISQSRLRVVDFSSRWKDF